MYSLIKNTYTSQKCSAATRCSPWHTYKNKLANASLLFALIFINQFVIAQSSISGNQDFKLLNEGDFKPANSKNINIQATINENSFNNFALSSDKIDGLRANSFGTATSDLITNNRLVCPIITHNAFTNFNSSNPSNVATTLWVNIHTKLTGQLSSNGDFLLFTSGNIQLTSITATWSSAVITDGKIIADNSVSVPTTSFDIPNNIWITKVPLGYSSSDIFITGAAIISTTGYEVSSGKQSEISGNFYSNVTFSSSWFYGSAAYQPAFTLTDIAGAGIVSSIGDGIKAGTPTNQQAYLVPGGSGGGASNYTGSYSSVDDFTACLGAPTCSNVTQGGTVGTDQTFCSSGNPVAFTSSVAASGGTGTLEYQWQSSPDNSTWSDISGATADTYDAPSISATTYYRRAARRSGCSPYAFYSNVITVTINAIPAVPAGANNSRCGTGTVTLSASGCAGTYNWYAASTGGASLSTTATYTTPSISATTTYYVDCTVGSCPSTKVATTATINAIPLVPSGSNNSRCGPGTVILTGSGCSGTYNWYAASTGGASLSTTTSYTTPSISTTTTYYVDCTVNGCISTSRAAATATIIAIPAEPTGVNNSRCSTGTVTLSASGCAGTYNWYAASTGGASLSTTTSYTTPSISTTTTYYVDCTVSNCPSTRTAVTAIINAIPSVPTGANNSRCGPGTVILTGSGCAGTYNWYATSTGGASLSATATYTTPSISTTTTYYVDCTVNGCLSATRGPATATINTIPSVPTGANNSRCGPGTVILTGSGCSGTYNWYAASTGGASLSTTTSYTTPSISTTTTYYVDCTVNGCASASRDPAIATINIIPVPVGANNSRCSTGTVTLSASGCAGTYNWYAASTGGASLSAKATYTTPSISTTTTYYVDCTVSACVSTRDPAIATINAIPAAPTTIPGNRCGPGTVVLSNNCAGTSNWFSALTGGTSLGTGTTFTTPSIISNTTYYADCSVNGCLSTTRASALATVLTPPTATASNSGVHCLGTTFKLIGGGDGVSFSWSGPDSFTSTSQSPLVPSASADMAGVYTLTVTASNGCTTTATTNLVINTNCNSICTSVISVVPTNPTGCSATDGSIFISEYSGGPFYENSIDGITWYNSEKTYSNLGVGYHTIFIRDKTSQIICRTVSATLTAITTAYYTGETVTNATSCTGTNGSIALQGVVGTDKVSWISSTNRTYVAVSTLSPTNTISNLAAGQYYVIVTRGGNPLFCYSERMVTIANSGTPCTAGLCTASGSSNLFPNGDFGSGSSKIGTPLLSSETQYSFAPMNCDSPNDGNYTITNTSDCNGATAGGNIFGTWDILTQDHTTGDTDGYMMIVNASFNPDIVIEKTITNLCPNTKYEYSLWIYNLCPPTNTSGCPIKPNLTFLIDGVGKYNTGTLNTSGWQQVGFTFSTGNSTSSTFSIRNNALGGLGNDWVIDDISITQCLPTINQSASASKCIGTTAQTVSATVTDVNQQYQYYKWQESTDNGSTWADLTSATLASFSSNTYTVSYNLPSPITLALNGRKYRIIVGTSTANLANSSCSFLSTGTTIIVPTIAVTTSTTQTICLGSSASITANATGGTSPYTYTWNNGAGAGSPKSVSPSSTTTYTVTVTDANACSATATTQVIVSTLPSAPAPSNNSRCGTGTVALLASGCSGGTINWYASATGGTGLTTGTNYTTPSISATTIYYLECTVNGCTSASRSSVVATVNPIPTVSLSNQTICSGQTISLTPTGLSNASTYSWNTGAAISSISVSPTTTESYTLTVSSAPGCTATASASVTVNPQPTVGMSNQMVCQNTVLTLTPTITSGSSFLWNTGATTSTLGVPTSTVGTINYTITVTGSTGGCTATASASVTVNALPTTTLSAPTICAGESTTLTPTGLSNATVFSWSTGATTSTINVSPSVTTLYTLIVSSAASCSITKSVLVEVNPIPTANVIVVNSACLGSVSRNNGMLILNRYRNTDTVAYGSPISASPIFNNVPVGGVFSNNLPNTNTTYTIRVKNIYGCTSNITAQTTPVVCACPAGYCEPVIVIKTK